VEFLGGLEHGVGAEGGPADDFLGSGFREQVAVVPGTKRSTCPIHEALSRWLSDFRQENLRFSAAPYRKGLITCTPP
jgi:hypothetical protein